MDLRSGAVVLRFAVANPKTVENRYAQPSDFKVRFQHCPDNKFSRDRKRKNGEARCSQVFFSINSLQASHFEAASQGKGNASSFKN